MLISSRVSCFLLRQRSWINLSQKQVLLLDKFNGQLDLSTLSSKVPLFWLKMPKNICSIIINWFLEYGKCFGWGSAHIKFVTNFIIQLCPSFISWVPPCNRCFQAQVLKKITCSCVMWISCVGFILAQVQHLELDSTARKRNMLKNYRLSAELRLTRWVRKESLFVFQYLLNFHNVLMIWSRLNSS